MEGVSGGALDFLVHVQDSAYILESISFFFFFLFFFLFTYVCLSLVDCLFYYGLYGRST